MNNIYRILEESTKKNGDKTAIIFGQHSITYTSLKEASDRLASGMKNMGISSGDRIALMLPNNPHFVISYFAMLKIGVIIVPISTYDKPNEIHHRLEDCEAKGIIYSDKYRQIVQTACQGLENCARMIVLGSKSGQGEIRLTYMMETHESLDSTVENSLDDTALIVYTAGITGRPKGAELTHQNLLSNIESCAQFLKLKSQDCVASTVPFFFTFGQVLAMGSFIYSGASLVLLPQFNIHTVLKVIKERHPNYFVSHPSLIQEILIYSEEEPDLSSLNFWLTSGDVLKSEIMESFESRFKVPILEGYGLTEATSMVSFNNPAGERKPGAIGLPLPGVEIKIVDHQNLEVMSGEIGEIIVQGPNVMKGYLNRPEATKETIRDGWLYTGDLALLDESGYCYIVARKKNVIMKSGFSVYPTEVEKCLSDHPKIKEAVVVGLPDPTTGEEIHACVVIKQGENATPAEIIEYTREHLAAYKCPKTVFFILSLPKGPTGRVKRDQIKTTVQEKLNKQDV